MKKLLSGTNWHQLVAHRDDRGVSIFFLVYVLVCLAVVLALADTVRGDEEPVFKDKPVSYWIAELKWDLTRGRRAIEQFSPEARDCVPALIEAFRHQPLTIHTSSCNPP